MPRDPEEIVITTGPIPGSRKVYVDSGPDGSLKVPFREVVLEASANEAPVRLYDTSGPYTEENARFDVQKGLPPMRADWIHARGDVEEYEGREIRPEDNHRKEGDPRTVAEFTNKRPPLRAKPGRQSILRDVRSGA